MMRLDRFRGSHRRNVSTLRRRSSRPMHLEALEGRRLLSLTMVKDIDKIDTFPANITPVGVKIYFTTRAADHGTNLNVMSGSTITVLKDFNNPTGQSTSQNVAQLTAVGSKLFFTANDGGTGNELWVTDGTAAGTKLVKDLNPNVRAGSYPSHLTAVGSKLFFTVDNVPGVVATTGRDVVYKSDGTAAGTSPLAPLSTPSPIPGGGVSPDLAIAALGANDLVSFNGKLFAASGTNLVATDGTSSGTTIVGTFPSPYASYLPAITDLTVVGSKLDFVAYDGTKTALYSNNGTVGGTAKLRSFVPTSSNPFYAPRVLNALTAAGGKLFFTSDDATNGAALWVSDNTVAGTKLVKPINSIYHSGFLINAPTAVGSKFYYTVVSGTGTTGIDLWVSDGTTPGTIKLKDLSPPTQSDSSDGRSMAGLNGVLYFANWGPAHGNQLWTSNGTVAGTTLFKTLNPSGDAFPGHMTTINNTLYFSTLDGSGQNTLWKSNGTWGGTVKVAGFTPNANANGFSGSSSFAVLGNTLIGAANGGVVGRELWRTNGTTTGTVIVKDIVPGPISSYPSHFTAVNLTNVGSRVFFSAETPTGDQLWLTDGSDAGTKKVANLNGPIASAKALNGKLAFFERVSSGGNTTYQLWVSNGTASGTTMLKSFATLSGGYYSGSSALRILNGKLYFGAGATPMSTRTLWVSNLTVAGTKQVVASPTFTNVFDLMPFNGKIYFSAYDSTPGAELWSSDGTAAGTKRIKNLGGTSSALDGITVAGSTLYFVGRSYTMSTSTTTLWKSNGTTAGTSLVHDFGQNYVSSYTEVGFPSGKLVFGVQTATTPGGPNMYEPWVSNGTASGTKLLSNIALGYTDTAPRLVGGLYYFAGNDGTHGMELWRSDGTVAGTWMLADINPGHMSSDPVPLAIVNGNGLIVANDGIHGAELFTTGNPAAASVMVRASRSAPATAASDLNLTPLAIDYRIGSDNTFAAAGRKPTMPAHGGTPRREFPRSYIRSQLFGTGGVWKFRGRSSE